MHGMKNTKIVQYKSTLVQFELHTQTGEVRQRNRSEVREGKAVLEESLCCLR